MNRMKRFAIYYAPRDGAFADAAAGWLGWDARTGQDLQQPPVPGLAGMTTAPRRYGFHGTIKPPFRLAGDSTPEELCLAVKTHAALLQKVEMAGIALFQHDGFVALVPLGDAAPLRALAAEVVQGLDHFRAPLTTTEVSRRRPECLTERQRNLLTLYGYPYVMEEFQFHLTLSDKLPPTRADDLQKAASSHFSGLLPQPFVIEDLCLFGEDQDNRFHLLHRYPLIA